MRILILITSLTFILITFTSCTEEKIDLETLVDEKIIEIENFIDLNTTKISVDPILEKDLDDYSGAFKDEKKYDPSFFDSLEIETTSRFPNSYFLIKYNEYDLSNLLGHNNFYFGNNPERKPKFEIQNVFYADGTKLAGSKAILTTAEAMKMPYFENDDNEKMIQNGDYFFQNNNKPIIGAEVKVISNFTNTKDYPVEKNQKFLKTNHGDIEIITFENNEFTFKYPSDLEGKIEVNAHYKNGEFLTIKGAQTFESNQTIQEFKLFIATLKTAKRKILENKIKSEEELENYLQSQISSTEAQPDPFVTKSLYFATTISKIIISVVQEDKTVEKLHKYTISEFEQERYRETKHAITQDAKTNKKGITDFNGNWLIQPLYYDLSEHNFVKNYINAAVDKNDDINKVYWIDMKNNTLAKLNYDLNSYSLRKDHPVLMVVGSLDNQKDEVGVANKETGKLIIPIEYDVITFSKGTIICEFFNKKNSAKIFDESGKEIGVPQKK